jgi:hypothetical protein
MSTFIDRLSTASMLVADPTKVINITPAHTSTTTGIWSQLDQVTHTDSDPYEDPIKLIRSRLDKLETQNKFLKLKILEIEGKFSKEEIINLRAMLTSNDEASITLADTIIETA